MKFKSPIHWWTKPLKKPPQLSPGDPCALAAFFKRPQAALQIGALELSPSAALEDNQKLSCLC
jgi:hypothetical protein